MVRPGKRRDSPTSAKRRKAERKGAQGTRDVREACLRVTRTPTQQPPRPAPRPPPRLPGCPARGRPGGADFRRKPPPPSRAYAVRLTTVVSRLPGPRFLPSALSPSSAPTPSGPKRGLGGGCGSPGRCPASNPVSFPSTAGDLSRVGHCAPPFLVLPLAHFQVFFAIQTHSDYFILDVWRFPDS